MEPTTEQIQEFRNNFLQKLEAFDEPDKIHPADIARIKNNDDWLRRFLLHTELDFNESLDLLWNACLWRSSFGTNEIAENNIRKDILEDGMLFPHNKDKDGRTLLIFKCKNYLKGQNDMEEVKRCIVYWFERLERSENGQPITIFFDMTDSGISNLDMELTKYLINLFKFYYPYFLNYILIFELPWILTAALKVIKTWLPTKAVQKLKVLNKSSLKEFVTPDQALKVWGGTDEYIFQFISEPKMSTSVDDNRKKVHFAKGSPTEESYSQGFGDIKEEELNSLLHVHPDDAINFVTAGKELSGVTNLINMSNQLIAFKVKTTSPEKYYVRPSQGILDPTGSTTVKMVVHGVYSNSDINKDRFLIMHSAVDSEMNSKQLSDFWRQISPKSIKQIKLKCNKETSDHGILKNDSVLEKIDELSVKKLLTLLSKEVSILKEENMRLQSQVNFNIKINILVILIIIAGTLLVTYIFFESYEFRGRPKACMLNE